MTAKFFRMYLVTVKENIQFGVSGCLHFNYTQFANLEHNVFCGIY